MELALCRVVESFCSPTHNIVPHISWHDLPCHRTTKQYADFPSMVIFQLLLRKFWIQTWFCICQQYLCSFHIVFGLIPGKRDQGMMLVLPNFHIGLMFCFLSSQFLCHPHTQIRTILFSRCTNKHSQWKTFSQPYFNRIFSNCLSHNSPAKGWVFDTGFRDLVGTTGSSTGPIQMCRHGQLCRE